MTKILLVEDDKSLREIYGVRLLAEGYDIISAGDGEEALAMAIKERPALIVSDVMMPKISGFDMLDILRSTTETKNIKVIMMTALSSEDQRQRGEALGADRYLVKSQVGIEDVVRTVHDVLGDAPVATPSPAQTFGGPTPTSEAPAPAATPRPAPSIPQRPTPPPAPSFTPQPLAPAPEPAPTAPAPPPRPMAPPASASTAPAPPPAPAPSGLPQPTAPFSTTRPANLGDRIIHPLTSDSSPKRDLSSLMDEELSKPEANAAPQPPTPPAPAPASAPEPAAAPAPAVQPQSQPAAVEPPMPIEPPAGPAAPTPQTSTPEPQDTGIDFEETPRPPQPQA